MAINPSCNSVIGKAFPNLGDPPFRLSKLIIAGNELLEAFPTATFTETSEVIQCYKKGTYAYKMASAGIRGGFEVPPEDIEDVKVYHLTAEADGWKFRRAWYYWVCYTESKPIPKSIATEFNKTWEEQVRVDGFGGGQSVKGDVDHYHVDTPAGLNALGELIRSLGGEK